MALLDYVFGTTEENNYDSLGVWPESNTYFKNFKRVLFGSDVEF